MPRIGNLHPSPHQQHHPWTSCLWPSTSRSYANARRNPFRRRIDSHRRSHPRRDRYSTSSISGHPVFSPFSSCAARVHPKGTRRHSHLLCPSSCPSSCSYPCHRHSDTRLRHSCIHRRVSPCAASCRSSGVWSPCIPNHSLELPDSQEGRRWARTVLYADRDAAQHSSTICHLKLEEGTPGSTT